MSKISLLDVLAYELFLKHITAGETGPTAEWTVLSQSIYPYLAKKKNLSRFRYFFIEKNNFENLKKLILENRKFK